MPNIITANLRHENVDNFMEMIDNEFLYFAFSNPDSWTDENSPPTPEDSVALKADVFSDMLYGKRVTIGNTSRVIRNYGYRTGLRYQQWSDSVSIDKLTSVRTFIRAQGTASVSGGEVTGITIDNPGAEYSTAPTISITGGGGNGATATCQIINGSVVSVTITGAGTGYTSAPTVTFTYPSNIELSSVEFRPFYVVTNDFRVYKCLNNNSNGVSSLEPESVDTENPIQTLDDYVWKYMFTLSTAAVEKYYTSNWVPVSTLREDDGLTDQWEVQQNALGSTGVYPHGADPEKELNATNLMVKVRVTGSESDSIPDENDYRQISLIKNPIFASSVYNAGFDTYVAGATGATGIAAADTSVDLNDSTSLLSTNDVIQINDERMLVTTGATSPIDVSRGYDGTTATFHFAGDEVNIISDSTKILLNATHAAGATGFYYPDAGKKITLLSGPGKGQTRTIDSYSNPEVTLTEAWTISPTVDTTYGILANSLVYNQCVVLELGVVTSGPFSVDSTVTQVTSLATGTVVQHDTDSSPELLYLTNITGTFNGSNNVSSGPTSSTVTGVTQPALDDENGEVLYIEDRKLITRYPDQIEDIKVILQF